MDMRVPKAPRVEWTEERIALMLKLNEEGLSRGEIAKRMNCGMTRNAVIGKLARLGIICTSGLKGARPCKPKQEKTEPSKPAPLPKLKVLDVGIGHVHFTERGRSYNRRGDARLREVKLPEPVPFTNGSRVTLMQLSSSTCKWPIGDPGTEDFCFCGHAPRENSPYCEFHARAAYVPLEHKRHRVFG